MPLVLAAAEAWRQRGGATAAEERAARELVDRVRRAAASVRDVEVVGDPEDRLPHVVTFSVLYADGEVLLEELARRGLVVASGSACTSSALRPSHVLAAMGVLTHGNVRVTLPLAGGLPQPRRRRRAALPRAAGCRRDGAPPPRDGGPVTGAPPVVDARGTRCPVPVTGPPSRGDGAPPPRHPAARQSR